MATVTMADTIKGLGTAQVGMLAGVAILLLGFFAIIAMRVSAPTFTSMYSNLSVEDSAQIVSELERQNIPFQIRANGSEIAVPSDQMLRLRMSMAEQGLLSTGGIVGYEIFDKDDAFGRSQFVLNVNMARALEGELARTIGAFQQVDSARVHLVIPKRELFARRKQETTASIALKMRGNMELEKGQVAAIVNFVSAAVPGLKPSKITLVDSYGRMLARPDSDDGVGTMAAESADYQISFENRMRDNLEELVRQVVGPGRVQVKVNADIDFDRLVTNKEIYDPEGAVPRSTQSSSETSNMEEKAGAGAVSAANQLPGANAASGEGARENRETEKTDETTNFEISKTVQNHIKESGTIKKLSVAVLVDGNYVKNDGDWEYVARTEDELAKISDLVKTAIGFDELRGDVLEVVNMRFVKPEEVLIEETFFEKFKEQMEGIIRTLLIVVAVVFIVLVVVKPAVTHMIRTSGATSDKIAESLGSIGDAAAGALNRIPAAPTSAAGAGGAIASIPGMPGAAVEEEDDELISIANIQGGVSSRMIKQISEFVDSNPDETVTVMRNWMAGEEE